MQLKCVSIDVSPILDLEPVWLNVLEVLSLVVLPLSDNLRIRNPFDLIVNQIGQNVCSLFDISDFVFKLLANVRLVKQKDSLWDLVNSLLVKIKHSSVASLKILENVLHITAFLDDEWEGIQSGVVLDLGDEPVQSRLAVLAFNI